MPVVISHPTGNEFFRSAAGGLYDAGLLQALYTSIACFPGSPLYNAGSLKMFRDVRRRSLASRFKPVTHTYPLKEAFRLLALKIGNGKLARHETGIFSMDAVYAGLDKYVAGKLEKEKQKGASAIYAYEDGALYSFEKAAKIGLKCFYDLPIGYWKAMHKILEEEKGKNPEWAATLGGLKDSVQKLERKDKEIALADRIIVASTFTLQTLMQYNDKLPQVRVIPYGFPPVTEKEYRIFSNNTKLRLLFVGGLSQRKGLSYLFESVKGLESYVTLTVVGQGNTDCKPLKEKLLQHRWITSVPHDTILQLMREHDVLVFPSLFEGFGQVITEAMSQGTPVITTDRTIGPDIIKNRENGWLVKSGSAEAIKQVVEELLMHPEQIAAQGEQAIATAAKRPWTEYGNDLVKAITEIKMPDKVF